MWACPSASREGAGKSVARITFLFGLITSLVVASLATFGGLRAPDCNCAIVDGRATAPRSEYAWQTEDPPLGRVVIIAGVTEQLGKATSHIEDMFDLCIRSNRTCVLPGIANGQFALDGYLNFNDVFSAASFPASLHMIAWERFAKQLRHLPSPRILVCAFGRERLDPRNLAMFYRTVLFYQPQATFYFDEVCGRGVVGFPADAALQEGNLKAMASVLSRDDPIIAVFHFDWSEALPRSSVLASDNYTGLAFSASFYDQAVAFRERFGDYIHLQWRMEKADGGLTTNFTACARAAIQHVKSLARNTSVAQVYFSSDVGRDGFPWSNSFHGTIPKDALNALNLIYAEFPNVLTWVNVSAPALPRYDMAAIGVIDRLIAMGSTYFVRGPKACSRVGAYVQSIAKWRKTRMATTRDGGAPTSDDGFGSRIMNEFDEYTLL